MEVTIATALQKLRVLKGLKDYGPNSGKGQTRLHGTFVQKVRLNTGAALDTNDAASELHPPHHAANTRDFRSSSIKNRNGTSVLEQKERCFFLQKMRQCARLIFSLTDCFRGFEVQMTLKKVLLHL